MGLKYDNLLSVSADNDALSLFGLNRSLWDSFCSNGNK